MSLLERLRQLSNEPRNHAVVPLRPATQPVPLAWLQPDADVWDDYPELDDVMDELTSYYPLASARLSDSEFRCVVVHRNAPHPVSMFYEGFQRVAPSLDAFIAALLLPGEKPVATTLEGAVEAASARLDAKDYSAAVALLTPALSRHPRAPGENPERALRDLLRAGWTDLGVAHHELGDDHAAADAYRVAVAWGSKTACGNLLQIAVDAKQWNDARSLMSDLSSFYLPPDEMNAFRVTSTQTLAELGERDEALALAAKHAEYVREVAKQERTRGEALQKSFLTALDALSVSAEGKQIVDAVRHVVAAPLPPAPGPGEPTLAEIATAVRLIEAAKVRQLRSLFTKVPALMKHPEVTSTVAQSTQASEIQNLISEVLLETARQG